MKTAIIVSPEFEAVWPFVLDRLLELLQPLAEVAVTRVRSASFPIRETTDDPATIQRLIALGPTPDEADLAAFPALAEIYVSPWTPQSLVQHLTARGIRQLSHGSEGFWGQSVAEFALGLTISGLRRIPQTHHAIVSGLEEWQYAYGQFSDDPRFASGTVEGKQVRIVGAGNIASRYASFMHMLGAHVAAWDPYASEPSFHRSGARRERHLDRLVEDAEIFAPMVPLTDGTAGLVTAAHVRALPKGCLVVLVTRAQIVDMSELRRRVLADELSLAADVHDAEPLPLDDPLLGRPNVVHTPHLAGRTRDANLRWAEALVEQSPEYDHRLAPVRN